MMNLVQQMIKKTNDLHLSFYQISARNKNINKLGYMYGYLPFRYAIRSDGVYLNPFPTGVGYTVDDFLINK